MRRVIDVIQGRNPKTLLPVMSNLNHAVDAYLTYLIKKRGDVADVAQNMRILQRLAREDRRVARQPFVRALSKQAEKFERLYSFRRATPADYSRTVYESLPDLTRLNKALSLGQKPAIETMRSSRKDPQAMQRAHHQFLIGWLNSQ